ncbi:MAG: septation protein SepH [Nocardioides sp.]
MAAPAPLTLVSVSTDGTRLLLVDDQGTEFALDITPALRAAVRGDGSRLGQLEISMDSALRPRDIQARIRAGESPEAVAQAAQTTVEKILPFVGPVLAERQHVAERAQRSNLRRPAGAEAATRTLGEAVAAHLRAHNVDPDGLEWDAWRREDGRWTLIASYSSGTRSGIGEFTFDPPGNYVVLDNEDARWLVGEQVMVATPERRDDLQSLRERRLTSVAEDELPLGDDVLDLANNEPAGTADPVVAADDVEAAALEAPAEPDVEALDDAAADDDEHDPAADEPPSRRPVAKKKGRASVPSWDEIMFGGSDQ